MQGSDLRDSIMADDESSTEPKPSRISLSGCAPIALCFLVMYVGAFVASVYFGLWQINEPTTYTLALLFRPLIWLIFDVLIVPGSDASYRYYPDDSSLNFNL